MYFFIRQVFEPYSFVTVVDDFPTTELDIPTVSVRNGQITTFEYELGNRRRVDKRLFFIDVFAKNKSQRDDFAYLIKNEVQTGIPVYDFNDGFPIDENGTPTGKTLGVEIAKLSTMHPEEITVNPITVMPELVEKLYWRSEVFLSVQDSQPIT